MTSSRKAMRILFHQAQTRTLSNPAPCCAFNSRSRRLFPLHQRRQLEPFQLSSLRFYSTTNTVSESESKANSKTVPPPASAKSRSFPRFLLYVALAGAGATVGQMTGLFDNSSNNLSPERFVPLKIKSIHRLSDDTTLFKLALPKDKLPDMESPGAPIKSLFIMQPDLQIQRPYTPLDAASFTSSGTGTVDILLKRYDQGELSRWMHRLGPGDEVRVRGPVNNWTVPEEGIEEVVFVVGGTGITPAYQLLQHLSSHPESSATLKPRISILYASPTPSTILLKDDLDSFVKVNPLNVSVKYFVDKARKGDKGDWTVARLDLKVLRTLLGKGGDAGVTVSGKKMVVVCGPEGMVNAIAGPRARDLSQGPVGGVLGQLGYTSDQVIKL
ncbi:ferredoxin reductase-like protein [Meredithblackwellia eburnea MCA 4105]